MGIHNAGAGGLPQKQKNHGTYSPAENGAVLRDIDLGPSPPGVMTIRITGFKANGKKAMFTKKITGGVAETVWTRANGKDGDSIPDTIPFLSIQPHEVFILVDSVSYLDVVQHLNADDSLVWRSSDSL